MCGIRRAPHLVYCSAVAILKFSIIFKQGVLHFSVINSGSFLKQELVQTDLAGTLSSGGHRCRLHSLRGKKSTGCVGVAKYSGVQACNSENRLVILMQGGFLDKKHK